MPLFLSVSEYIPASGLGLFYSTAVLLINFFIFFIFTALHCLLIVSHVQQQLLPGLQVQPGGQQEDAAPLKGQELWLLHASCLFLFFTDSVPDHHQPCALPGLRQKAGLSVHCADSGPGGELQPALHRERRPQAAEEEPHQLAQRHPDGEGPKRLGPGPDAFYCQHLNFRYH